MSATKSQTRQTPRMGPMRNMPTGKAKNLKKAWANLLSYAKPFRKSIIISMIFSLICTVSTLIGPLLIQEISDLLKASLTKPVNFNDIFKLCTILVCMYGIVLILNYFVGFLTSTVTRNIGKNLRRDISRKINLLPLSYIDHTSHGDLLSRMVNDVDSASQSLDQSITTIIASVLSFLGSLLIMLIKSPILALSAVAASIIGFVLTSIIMKKSQKHFIAQQQSLGELNGHIEEIYGGHIIVKAYNAENESIQKFNKINKQLYNSSWKAQFLSGLMMPIMHFIGNLGFVVVCVVGGILVVNKDISFGVISAFLIFIRMFTSSLSQLAQVTSSIQTAGAASERIFHFLKQKELDDESHKTKKLTDCKGNVEFKNVRFGYYNDKTIIHDFNAKISAGQKVAIVGPTGAGKTTLVNLLMRFYEIDGGSIEIDGIDIKQLTRDNVHNLFSMVLQDTWIYNASIKENVKYSKVDVTDQQIIDACKTVGIHHFIKTLPEGYDTILDDNTSISAGQKQLLTIARAMIQNSPMLILDEATSSVDTRLELVIQEAMDKLTQNRTSFVIAHRLSTIKNADLILVMKEGDIIESGNHEQLLKQNGFYSELYMSQFEDA